jgi:hypothetical protein
VKVEILGAREAPRWNQAEKGLTVTAPKSIEGIPEYGIAVKAYLA